MTTGRAIALATERLVEPVEGMHRVIASRGFAFAGPLGRPIERVHDAIADTVYASVRYGGRAVGAAVDLVSRRRASGADTGAFLSFINAVWGDDLGSHEDRVAVEMSMTTPSGDRIPGPDAAGTATGHVVVIVHGLGQRETSWHNGDRPGLVDRLGADSGSSPILVRYNSGRSIAANGEELAVRLESVVRSWPVPVERITLVGHSLGGLVCRSACVAGSAEGHEWIDLVGDLVTTGAPHNGAPAEKAANVAAWGLGIARTTRPLAAFLNRRSRGIKDLRFGAIVESDWEGDDRDALLRDTVADHHLPGHIVHHAIATTIAEETDGPLAWLMGDGMVRVRSATTPRGSEAVAVSVTGAVDHFAMQRNERVIDAIVRVVQATGRE